jgi:tetratricopeptide (TPR) repeat protein
MRFERRDYRESLRRRNLTIASLAGAAVIIIVVFLLLNKSPSPGGEERTAAVKPAAAAPATTPAKDLPALVAQVRKSVVLIKTFNAGNKPLGQGTGFFISANGVMISNRHVFRGAHRAEVEGVSGKFSVSKVLAEHGDYDLVRLQVDLNKKRVQPLVINRALPRIGEKVLVIGNPLGLEASVSDGIVSAVRKLEPFGSVIQITSPISQGSSGSPVLNMKGEVIGVATFQMRRGQNLNFAVPITNLARLKKVEGGEMAAINFYDNSLLETAENPFDQGMILFDRKEYAGAIGFFKKAVEKNQQQAEAYFHLGICYRETGHTNAVDAFKSAVGLRPGYAEAYCHMGITYNRLNMPVEAIDAFRKALNIRSDYDEALMNLGIAYHLKKNYKAAANALERALDIFPDAKAYYYLGSSYAQLKQYEKGIRAFTRAIEIDSKMLDAYLALGASYVAIQYWTRGIKICNQAVLLAPNNMELHFLLGILHLGNDDLDSAKREYELLRNLKGNRKYRDELGRAISNYQYRRRRKYR